MAKKKKSILKIKDLLCIFTLFILKRKKQDEGLWRGWKVYTNREEKKMSKENVKKAHTKPLKIYSIDFFFVGFMRHCLFCYIFGLNYQTEEGLMGYE